MKHIHVLSAGFTNPNSSSFLYPLIIFRRTLQEAGFKINFFWNWSDHMTECDVLLIEHKTITKSWDNEKSLSQLEQLHKKTEIIWCDQSDSTGTFLGQVLPYVHKYLKAQTLSNLENYKKKYHGDRVYTDYYHQKHGITDKIFYDYETAQNSELEKISLSWNSGFLNHGVFGPYLNKIAKHVSFSPFIRFSRALAAAEQQRPLNLSARMGISYPRATVRYQREQIRDLLKEHMPTDKISRRQYFQELKNSKICVSPFGYGEITLKDFEAFLCGSLLLKPDMSHMQTWPNFYEDGKTYISHDWNLENLEEKIEYYLKNEQERLEIAEEAQKCYLKYTVSKEAPEIFVKHFANCVDVK